MGVKGTKYSTKSKVAYCVYQSFQDYKYKDKKDPLYVDYPMYRDIIDEFFKRLTLRLILSGEEITLPSKLGHLKIFKMKPRKRLIDHAASIKKYGKGAKQYVYLDLSKTNGYMPILIWSNAVFATSSYYTVNMVRTAIRDSGTVGTYKIPVTLYDYFNKEGYLRYDEHLVPKKLKIQKNAVKQKNDRLKAYEGLTKEEIEHKVITTPGVIRKTVLNKLGFTFEESLDIIERHKAYLRSLKEQKAQVRLELKQKTLDIKTDKDIARDNLNL